MVGHIRVNAKTNEHKVALKLLGIVSVAGKIITGDAVFCQTEIAETLAKEGADYILHMKDNQPTVKNRIDELLDLVGGFPPVQSPDPDVSTAQTVEKGHGRLEIRTAQSCELLSACCGRTVSRTRNKWFESSGCGK